MMTNSGMVCACRDGCDQWHPTEDFVHDFGFLPFPPYTKYHKLFDRTDAQLLGENRTEQQLLGERGRQFVMYRRDDPPQYAAPPADHATRYKDIFGEFADPCPETGQRAAWCN